MYGQGDDKCQRQRTASSVTVVVQTHPLDFYVGCVPGLYPWQVVTGHNSKQPADAVSWLLSSMSPLGFVCWRCAWFTSMASGDRPHLQQSAVRRTGAGRLPSPPPPLGFVHGGVLSVHIRLIPLDISDVCAWTGWARSRGLCAWHLYHMDWQPAGIWC